MRRTAALAAAMTMWVVMMPDGKAAQFETPAITIRLHDYAHAAPQELARAQQIVTAIYQPVGVRVQWASTMTLAEGRETVEDRDTVEDLTVNVLSRRMSERRTFPKDAMGSAAVGADGGRIAYVLYDRVAAAAAAAAWPLEDLLGIVVAHEIGHLLLPHGAHSPDGLMQARWDVSELRRRGRRPFGLTGAQATLIREHLGVGVAAAQ
jgi:hypothetical protein